MWVSCSKSATVPGCLEARWYRQGLSTHYHQTTHVAAIFPRTQPRRWPWLMHLGFWSHCLLCAMALQHKSGLGKELSHDLCAAPSTGKGPAAVISFLQACISRAGGVTGRKDPGNFRSHPALGIGHWPSPGVLEPSRCPETFRSCCGKAIRHVSGQQDS